MLITTDKRSPTGVTRALRATPAIMHFNFYDRAKEDVVFETEMGSLVNDIRLAFHMAPSPAPLTQKRTIDPSNLAKAPAPADLKISSQLHNWA